ncbi:MAG: J domain-containing protein [Nostoc sp. ChiSLP01]|nr:DnaJ domain-containing protein [Nostoc sp. CmiSLP01]MDZ8286124.1 DnaJ domain-containing protein [Nostoc sp. ChiSLP01]
MDNNLEQYYQVLGVSSDASVDEIKQAYKDLVQVWYPDRHANNPGLQRRAETKLKAINSAYEIIMESLASGHNVRKTTNVYKNESYSTQVSEPEPVVEVKTDLLSKVKSWINKNKLILITGTTILISLQIYAYTKYKDFPFSNPILLIQRIYSSFFLERNIGDKQLGYSSIKFSSNGAIFSSAGNPLLSKQIKIWDFHSGKKLKSFSVNYFNSESPHILFYFIHCINARILSPNL